MTRITFYFVLCCLLNNYTCAVGDKLLKAYMYEGRYVKRQELVIDQVSSLESFKVGRGVSKWQSVTTRYVNYGVGLTPDGVTVVTSRMNGSQIEHEENMIVLQGIPTSFKLFVNENKDRIKSSVMLVVVVCTDHCELEWFQLDQNSKAEKVWSWRVLKTVSHVNVFEANQFSNVLLVNNAEGYAAVDIYQYNFTRDSKTFWLSQTIGFQKAPKDTAISTHNSNCYLSIVQDHTLQIYLSKRGIFRLFESLSSQDIDSVLPINIQQRSHLAINGRNGGIFRVQEHGIFKEDIEHMHMENVDFWHPVVTYQNQAFVMVQRKLQFENHTSLAVDIVKFDGERFSALEEVACVFYGEMLSGISCIVEEDHHGRGIRGSANFKLGRNMGVLVPRNSENSMLFLVKFSKRTIPNPIKAKLEDLESTKRRLKQLLEMQQQAWAKIKRLQDSIFHQDKSIPAIAGIVEEALQNNSQSQTDFKLLEHDLKYLEKVSTDIKRNISETIQFENRIFKNFVIDGALNVRGNIKVRNASIEAINGQNTEELLADIVKSGDSTPITSKKSFRRLETQNLRVDTINGIPHTNIMFVNDNVSIDGDVVFESKLNVLGDVSITMDTINTVNLSENLVEAGKCYKDYMTFEALNSHSINIETINGYKFDLNYTFDSNENSFKLDNVQISGELKVHDVNGIAFNDLKERLCLKGIDNYIEGETEVNGTVVLHNGFVNYINNLKYPEEFITKTPVNENILDIKGKKIFEKIVTASEVSVSGFLNDMKTDSFITLSTNQSDLGDFSFDSIQVQKSLYVQGNITGALSDYQSNPTLKHASVIKSDVSFQNLSVKGNVFVRNECNGSNLSSMLNNVVLKDEYTNTLTINSTKNFTNDITIRGKLQTSSNSINDVPLTTFVHKIQDQVFSMDSLCGNITTDVLHITGTIDDVNVNNLYNNTFKLDEDQSLPITLIFEDEIVVDNFRVRNMINNEFVDEYMDKVMEINLSPSHVANLRVETLEVQGNFDGEVEEFNVTEYDDRRLSLTRDQNITGNFYASTCFIDVVLAENVNNYTYKELFDLDELAYMIGDMIMENKVKVLNLRVMGNLAIDYLNDVYFRSTFDDAFFQNNKRLPKDAKFLNHVQFEDLALINLNEADFDDITKNAVYKNNTSVQMTDTKVFKKEALIKKFIDVRFINEIPVRRILRKTTYQEVAGPITIVGNVTFNGNISVTKHLNGTSIEEFEKRFTLGEDAYIVHSDLLFENVTEIDKLNIHGFLNEQNVSEFLSNMVFTNDKRKSFSSTIAFTKHVNITKDLLANQINGQSFLNFSKNAMYIKSNSEIKTPITFKNKITLERLMIDGDLDIRYLMGVDLKQWKDNVMYVGEDIIPGNVIFQSVHVSNFLNTLVINDVNTSSLIPLHTDQTISQNMHFQNLFASGNISIYNLVNGYDLESEMNNTVVQNDDEQNVSSNVTFVGNVLVRENMTFSNINGFDFGKIVTTHTDQNLTLTCTYNEIKFQDNLYVYGLVSGVNLSEWDENAMRKKSFKAQYWEGIFNVLKNVTFESNIHTTSINGININDVVDELETMDHYRSKMEENLIDDYREICLDLNFLTKETKKKIYRYKYLDLVQEIDMKYSISHVYSFTHHGEDYLLVTDISCKTTLFMWSNSKYSLVYKINVGMVSQIIVVNETNDLYLVIRKKFTSKCGEDDGATTVWKFEDPNLLHVFTMPHQRLLQQSYLPGIFYGINDQYVIEYHISSNPELTLKQYRKWFVNVTDDLMFVPKGLNVGFALSDGSKLLQLHREEKQTPEVEEFSYQTQVVLIGHVSEQSNDILPGRGRGEVVTLSVGVPKRPLIAVSLYNEMNHDGSLKLVNLYEGVEKKSLYQTISAHKPSSLIALEFDNQETLLIFLEDKKLMKIYEYRGIEGFKISTSIDMEAEKLLPIQMKSSEGVNKQGLVVVNKNKLNILLSVMDGKRTNLGNVECVL